MAWFNELGILAVTPATRDVDLGRHGPLQLAAPLSFMNAMRQTGLPFFPVRGMPSHTPSTSVMAAGREGLRVDLLVPGTGVGRVIAVPDLEWHVQTIPHLDYLLAETESVTLLAGSHAVRVRVPSAARMAWHKLYSSVDVNRARDEAPKDLRQGLVLAAALSEEDPGVLLAAFEAVRKAMARAIAGIRDRLFAGAQGYLALEATFRECLPSPAVRSARSKAPSSP